MSSIQGPQGTSTNKIQKFITRCPHTDKKQYAKGMCNHCYHAYGRTKLATQCPHKNRLVYAKLMCISCYQKRKRAIRKQKLNDLQWPRAFKPAPYPNQKYTGYDSNDEHQQSFSDFLKLNQSPKVKFLSELKKSLP